MRNTVILLMVVLSSFCDRAMAFSLKVNSTVVEYFSGKPMPGARVRVYRDGVRLPDLAVDRNGNCTVRLDNHAAYVLRFDAPGYQVKCFTVDTHGMEWQDGHGVTQLDVEVMLTAKVHGVDLSFFDLPLGIAHFEPATGRLGWDKRYEQKIHAEAVSVMDRYVQRYTGLGHNAPLPDGDLGANLHPMLVEARPVVR